MIKLINTIKGRRRNSDSTIAMHQFHHVATLSIDIPLQPLLQPPVKNKVSHESRRRMQFHGHTVDGKPNMVETLILHLSIRIFHKRVSESPNLLTPSIHPYIHIARRPCRRIGYITAFPCPFKIQQGYPASLTLLYSATVALSSTSLRC